MKIIFFGTSGFAVPSLTELYHSPHKIETVVTQPDKRSGRGLKVRFTPVKEKALSLGLNVEQPEDILGESHAKLNDKETLNLLRSKDSDVFVVVSYGKILSSEILTIPELYSINLHGSLLPKYRGAAPINRVIINGENKTGVTVIKMIEKLDAGDILSSLEVNIGQDETAVELETRLSWMGAELLLDTLNRIEKGEVSFTAQDELKSSYAPKLKKIDGLINWNKSAYHIHNQVRGMTPYPCAFTSIEENGIKKLLKVWQTSLETNPKKGSDFKPGTVTGINKDGITVQTASGNILLKELQIEGGRRVSSYQFAMGHRMGIGAILGEE